MPVYTFNIHDGQSPPGNEAVVLANLADAQNEAVRLAGTLLTQRPTGFWDNDWSLDVADETGTVLFTLSMFATWRLDQAHPAEENG